MSNLSREHSAAAAALSPRTILYLLRAMRPKQWVKNAFVFAALAFVTASYRDVANRHRSKAEAYAARHGGGEHGGH